MNELRTNQKVSLIIASSLFLIVIVWMAYISFSLKKDYRAIKETMIEQRVEIADLTFRVIQLETKVGLSEIINEPMPTNEQRKGISIHD